MIPPGGEGEIKVTLTPKGAQEHINKHITVLSDDPEQPRFTLTMQGKLLVDIKALPAHINFRDLEPGAEASTRFEVQVTDPAATKILSVRVEDPDKFTLVALPDQDETGSKHGYELRFHGSKEFGSIGSRIEVETSNADTPQLLIPIRAVVSGNLRFAKRVQFVRRGGVIQSRPIRISARKGDAPRIGKIEDPDGLLSFSVAEPKAGAVVITATVDEEKYAALDEAGQRTLHKLVVHTNDREQPRLEIDYMVTMGVTPARRGPP